MDRLQQILVNEGYDLGPYGPKKDGVDGSPGKLTRDAARTWAKKQVQDLGLRWCHNNLVELRMSGIFTDKYSDICLVINKDECVALMPWTTKPGKYWINNPVTVGGVFGTGCVKEGQTINSHVFRKNGKRKWGNNGYFEQIEPIPIYRDGNKDKKLDRVVVQVAPRWWGFFIHSMGRGSIIWNWSAGCRGNIVKLWRKYIRPNFQDGQVISPIILDV